MQGNNCSQLDLEIDEKRKKLNDYVLKYGMLHEFTILISQELDILLNKKMEVSM